MAKKIVLVGVGLAAIGILLIVFSAWHTAGVISKYEVAQADVTDISVFMEVFRQEHGKYPSSLTELVLSESDADVKTNIDQILRERFQDNYEYQSLTNGFIIVHKGYKFEYKPVANGFAIIGKYVTNVVTSR